MSVSSHLARLTFLLLAVAGWLGWKASHAEIVYADSLRYIDQAKQFTGGDKLNALFHAVDHPAYPLVIAVSHKMLSGDNADHWALAAQVASVIGGVLLVIPMYLVALEMFGGGVAWLAVVLSFLVPITSQVMGDALSESWFLFFFSFGVWTAIRFLRDGKFAWLPGTVAFAALAYWVRPEALLLPVTLVLTLLVIPALRATRMNWTRWGVAMAFLVVGPGLLIAPIVMSKGGIATKPAVGRILGTTAASAPSAVERARPLKPGQTTAETYLLATRAMALAVRDAVTIPLLPLALLGFILAWPPGAKSRMWVFLTILMVVWALALIRLFATGGYCTPRHALILAYPLIASAAFGLSRLLAMVVIPGRWIGSEPDARFRLGPIGGLLSIAALAYGYRAELAKPINHQFEGYREAAFYLSLHVPIADKVVDVTGWSLFYSDHVGYTFPTLIEAMGDQSVKRVVVRDAHLDGPWEYCKQLRQLIGDRKPVLTFPTDAEPGQSKVYMYDWVKEQTAQAPSPTVVK